MWEARMFRILRVIVFGVSMYAFATASKGQQPTEETSLVGDKCGCGKQTTKEGSAVCWDDPPCHCLQQRWLNLPGPNDIYICLTHGPDDTCAEYVQEYWLGAPTAAFGPLPQLCTES